VVPGAPIDVVALHQILHILEYRKLCFCLLTRERPCQISCGNELTTFSWVIKSWDFTSEVGSRLKYINVNGSLVIWMQKWIDE
jgi:hypothetical protein